MRLPECSNKILRRRRYKQEKNELLWNILRRRNVGSCNMWADVQYSSGAYRWLINAWKIHENKCCLARKGHCKATKTHKCDTICLLGSCHWRRHDGSIWWTLLFNGVVDEMPLRLVITASCPADRGTQQPSPPTSSTTSSTSTSTSPERSDLAALRQNQNTLLSSCMHGERKMSDLAAKLWLLTLTLSRQK